MELFQYLFRLSYLINQACYHVTRHQEMQLFLWQIVSQNGVNSVEMRNKTGITPGAKFRDSVSWCKPHFVKFIYSVLYWWNLNPQKKD